MKSGVIENLWIAVLQKPWEQTVVEKHCLEACERHAKVTGCES